MLSQLDKITGHGRCNARPLTRPAVRSEVMSERDSICASEEKLPAVEYRELPGYPHYRIGSDGTVWSQLRRGRLQADGKKRFQPWYRLKTYVRKSGYAFVHIGPRLRRVHQLVLEAFVGPCPPGMEVRHFPDRDPANNNLSNLSYGTRVQNSFDKTLHGTAYRSGTRKLNESQVREIRQRLSDGESAGKLAKIFGVGKAAIFNIKSRRKWAWLE